MPFGALSALLTLYFRHLHLGAVHAYNLFGAFVALMWVATFIAGFMCSRWGYKQIALVGYILTLLGTTTLCFPGLNAVYFGLAIYLVGYGLSTTAFFSLVGLLYQREDKRRDSGHTFFYLLFNFGMAVAIILSGSIVVNWGYRSVFIFSSIAMLLATLFFVASIKTIKIAAEHKKAIQLTDWTFRNFSKIIMFSVLTVIAFFYLIEHLTINKLLLWILAVGSTLGVLYLAWKQPKRKERAKLLIFLFLTLLTIFFWVIYVLESSLLTVFIAKLVHTEIAGIHIPPAMFFSLDSIFVVILGLFFTWLWRYLAENKKDISMPTKFAVAFLVAACSVWIYSLSIHISGYGKVISPLWIILGFLLFTSGEIIIGPIGMSLVGRLSPPGKVGILMGVRNLYLGFSGVLAGYAANFTPIPIHASLAQTSHIYSNMFFGIGLVIFSVSILIFLLTPYIRRNLPK